MNPEKFKIHDLVLEILDSLEHKFTKKGRNIKYSIITNNLQNELVFADPERIDQVLRNLIDNAVKYGDALGTIYIELEAEGNDRILVKIRDEGQGISREHLPRIFERFYRVDKARSRHLGGTGLGLAIVKHIVQAHGGKVDVESTPGEGTTFTIHLLKI